MPQMNYYGYGYTENTNFFTGSIDPDGNILQWQGQTSALVGKSNEAIQEILDRLKEYKDKLIELGVISNKTPEQLAQEQQAKINEELLATMQELNNKGKYAELQNEEQIKINEQLLETVKSQADAINSLNLKLEGMIENGNNGPSIAASEQDASVEVKRK